MTSPRNESRRQDSAANELDGRRRRSAQSREAIGKAMFDLVGEGDPRPSAQRVADRAGVGIRTVFRHFDEMDRLYVEMDSRLRDVLRPLLARENPVGPLARRAERLVSVRCELYERMGPYRRAADLYRRRSDYLRRSHRETVREMRADLDRWIPELVDAPTTVANAVEVALSFEAWDRLRTTQGLSQKATRDVLGTLVDALLSRFAPTG